MKIPENVPEMHPNSYDPNEVVNIILSFVRGFATNCGLRGPMPTSNPALPYTLSRHSFCHQYQNQVVKGQPANNYRRGDVVDVLFTKQGKMYFISLFFDAERDQLHFRLIRLSADVPAGPLGKQLYFLRKLTSPDDRFIDEGIVPLGNDLQEAGVGVTDWLRHEVERDLKSLDWHGPPQ